MPDLLDREAHMSMSIPLFGNWLEISVEPFIKPLSWRSTWHWFSLFEGFYLYPLVNQSYLSIILSKWARLLTYTALIQLAMASWGRATLISLLCCYHALDSVMLSTLTATWCWMVNPLP